MNSSTETLVSSRAWAPALDLTPSGVARLDPARIQTAVAEGFDQGYADGHQAGLDAARAEAARWAEGEVDRLRGQMTDLFRALGQAEAAVAAEEARQAEIFAAHEIEVAMTLARAIIGRELSDPTVAAANACERALSSLDRTHRIHLRVNPEDAVLIDGLELHHDVEIEPDGTLERGDAVATTESRTVDARLSRALDRVRAALDGAA